MSEHVEQATAAPGEKRNLIRPKLCLSRFVADQRIQCGLSMGHDDDHRSIHPDSGHPYRWPDEAGVWSEDRADA